MWPLTQAWYGDRLSCGYAPRPVAELQALLTSAGLTAAFWQLA